MTTKPYVTVHHGTRPAYDVVMESERIVVGTAITCAVVIDDVGRGPRESPVFSREHFLLGPREDGCYVALARGAPTPILRDGVPFDRSVLPWGETISVGEVQFTLHKERREERPPLDLQMRVQRDALVLARWVAVRVLGGTQAMMGLIDNELEKLR